MLTQLDRLEQELLLDDPQLSTDEYTDLVHKAVRHRDTLVRISERITQLEQERG